MEQSPPLSKFTTIGLGGPAEKLIIVRTWKELVKAVASCKENNTPFFVLGGGSNVVFSDAGYPGTVLKMETRGIETVFEYAVGGKTSVRVKAGEHWDSFVAWTVANNLQGLECLSGIPGSCGATPIQNVGAYGQEVANTIIEVEALDTETLKKCLFSKEECHFSYRNSLFKTEAPGRYIITAVTFSLKRNGEPDIRYAELKQAAVESEAKTLAQVRELVIGIRRKKGMVVDPLDPDSKSCGSFFTNPIVPENLVAEVRQRCEARNIDHEKMPVFPYRPGEVKLSAAWLIERSGVQKGFTQNGAGISSKHSLALVNRGGSTIDLLAVKDLVQESVKSVFGIHLEPEPVMAGF